MSRAPEPEGSRYGIEELANHFKHRPDVIHGALRRAGVHVDTDGFAEISPQLYDALGEWVEVELKARTMEGRMSSAAPSTEAPLPDEAPASSEAARSSAGPAVRTASSAPPTPAQDATGIADFAFVVGRSSFDGALVDAEAADKVSAVQRWLLASPGPSVPRANIYPPVGSDWTNAGAEQLEMQLIDLVSAAEKAPEPPRLYVHVVGPLLAGDDAESIYLLCPDPQRPRHLGLHISALIEKLALSALFREVLLFVEGQEIELPIDDPRRAAGPAGRILELPLHRDANEGLVFLCAGIFPVAEDEDDARTGKQKARQRRAKGAAAKK